MEGYIKGKELGRGAFGTVVAAVRRADGAHVAIKSVASTGTVEGVHFTALREIHMLRDARHLNVVGLLDVFARADKLYLVFERCATDLWAVVQDRRFPLTGGYVKVPSERERGRGDIHFPPPSNTRA